MERCQASEMKLGYQRATELLFSSVLPATLVVLCYWLISLFYLERKAFILLPRRMLLACFLLTLCYFSQVYLLVCVVSNNLK